MNEIDLVNRPAEADTVLRAAFLLLFSEGAVGLFFNTSDRVHPKERSGHR